MNLTVVALSFIIKNTFEPEFKVKAVRLLESSQKSQAQIARELGVADSTLSQWRKNFAEHGFS